MTIIAERWPERLQPDSCKFGRLRAQVRPTSPTTRSEAIVRFGIPLWQADLSWQLGPWAISRARYFLDGMSAQQGSVLLRDFSVPCRTFVGRVTLSALAAAGATSVATTGWPASTTVLTAGAYVQIGRRLYLVASAVVSNGSGAATVTLDRPLRAAAASGDLVEYVRPACEMRLMDAEWDGARDARTGLWSVRAKFIETVEDVS